MKFKNNSIQRIITTRGISNYQADFEILKGLFVTNESDKITSNCISLGIQFDLNPSFEDQYNTKFSKRNEVVIITLRFDSLRVMQFLVKRNLDIKTLDKLSETEMSPELKNIILKSYDLCRKDKLEDLAR